MNPSSPIKSAVLLQIIFSIILLFCFPVSAQSTSPVAADVIVVVDESGSMSGEQAWLRQAIPLLEDQLLLYGVGSESQENFWGLVGFGNNRVVPRSFLMNGELFGTAQEFSAAAAGLVINGGTEDGWRGIQFAIDEYPRRNGAALNIILATDEDRDNTISSITYQSVLAALNDNRALLNAVVNVRLQCNVNTPALGMDSQGNGYVADGAGGFNTCENPRATSGAGASIAHYVNLALENGGAVWDLDFLRRGGHYAQSFTQAVLSIKVDEILGQKPLGDIVAIAEANPNPAVAGQSINLNGANSFHQIEGRNIIGWEWDLDNDGTFDAFGPLISTSFPATGIYPVTLRVTDDAETPASAQVTIDIDVNLPPLKPTANIGGPNLFCPQNTPWRLDASASSNPDDGLSEAGLPGDQITSYAWDLNNDLAFDDGEGALIDATSVLENLGVGDHLVRLRVEDNTAVAFPSSGSVNLFDTAVGQVSILDESDARCNCLTDLAARPKFTKVQLTWTDSGVPAYAVYRSETEGGPYTEIARTDNRYSTFLDLGLTLDTTYYYVVSELGTNGLPTCRSREVSATPSARRFNNSNRPPVINSAPVTSATEGVLYSYDVEATDPDAREILSFSLQLAPSGMTIDEVTGVIQWTPLNSQVGNQLVVVRVADNQGLFDEQVFSVAVTNVNQPPLINSSPVLNGTELVPYSYAVQAIDPDLGDVLTFSLSSAPTGMTINVSTGAISWTPAVGQSGTTNVMVVVTDSAAASDTQSFAIEVIEQNFPPSITSSPLVNAETETQYTYQVTATDPNTGDVLIYALGDFPEGMTIDANTGLINWIPTAQQIGSFPISVIATDPRSASATQSFTLTVALKNLAPEFVTTALDSGIEDTPYRFTVSAIDANAADVITYSIVSGPGGLVIDAATGELQWLPTQGAVGNNTVVVRATDSSGLFDEETFVLSVQNVNDAPAITSEPTITPLNSGNTFQYQVTALDSDPGDLVAFSLSQAPAGMTISPNGLIEWVPALDQAGQHSVVVLATDIAGLFDQQSFSLTVNAAPTAPQITSVPVTTGETAVSYQYQVIATDVNGDALAFSLTQAPTGMVIDATTGLISWTPADNQAGNFAVTVQVADPGSLTDTQSFTIAVAQGNRAPQIISTAITSGEEDKVYQYLVIASDADGDSLVFSLTNAPAGMSIDAATGVITWIPTETQIGQNTVVVEVADSNGAADSQSFSITVVAAPPNLPPIFVSTPGTSAIATQSYSYDADATDPENDTLVYSLGSAPGGMIIDAASGLVTWTPDPAQLGSHTVSISVDDGEGNQATQTYSVTVIEELANQPPVITSAPVTNAEAGSAYFYDVNATDANGDVLSFSLSVAPAGMTINASSGVISWVPGNGQIGNQPVTVVVIDGQGGNVQQSFSILVSEAPQPNRAPVINSVPNTSATLNLPYSYTVLASDPDGDALTYSLAIAPAGLTIDPSSGVVNWLPGSNNVGSSAVTVRVSDGVAYVEQSFSISVAAFILPLDITLAVSPSIANTGDTVTITAIAEGGQGNVSVNVVHDGQQLALTNGTATVVAAGPGRYDLIATVTDNSESVTSTAFYTVQDPTDSDAPTALITSPISGQTVEGSLVIQGTASDSNLASYRLVARLKGESELIEIAAGSSPVVAGPLGNLDTGMLVAGIYELILEVKDLNGAVALASKQFLVEDDVPVGNFSMTFEDMNVPLAGLSISLTRTYDSRQKFRSMDFGYGWSVNFQDINIQESQILGENFTTTASGGFFPTYCIQPVGSRYVSIKLPGKRSMRFNIQVQNNCQVLIPPQTADIIFVPAGGTLGTLTASGSNGLFYLGGLLTDDFLDGYDPNNYVLTADDGYVYNLDQNFGVRSIRDPNGNQITFNNNGVVHSNGTGIVFQRNSSGKITRITDPSGDAINYYYNIKGDLAAVVDREGNRVEYRYNRSHGVTEVIDPLGRKVARNIYDDSGQLVEIVDADGNTIEFERDLDANTEVVRDQNGNPTTFSYDDSGNVLSETDALGNTRSFTYDANGNQTSETNALGYTSEKTFDAAGRPLTETDPLGNTVTRAYSATGVVTGITDANGNTLSNTLDSRGNITQTTDALGNSTANNYDSAGNITVSTDKLGFVTNMTYDSNGRVATRTDPLGNIEQIIRDANGREISSIRQRTSQGIVVEVVQSKEYDRNGRITAEIDGEGGRLEFIYDGAGQLIREIDPLGNVKQHTYDAQGNKVRTDHADGMFETFAYDGLGNLISETDRASRQTSYEYDVLGRKTRTIFADGTFVSTTYDAIGNILSVRNENGDVTQYEYDEGGRKVAEIDALGNRTVFGYDANGNLTSKIDPLLRETTYEYDALDRRIAIHYSDGSSSQTTLDAIGQILAEVDQSGASTTYSYDSRGKLLSVTNSAGELTSYTYDEVGNQTAQTDAEGKVTTWTYDNAGRILSHTLPAGEVEFNTYDQAGNRIAHIDFNGAATSFEYDSNNNLVQKTFDDGSFETFSYTSTGKLATATDATGTTTYSYDDRDRLTSVSYPSGVTLGYTYDSVGNRTSITSPEGLTEYFYDDLNRLVSVVENLVLVTSYSYDEVGNRTGIIYPNGTQTNYQYDGLDRLTRLEHATTDGTLISSYDYVLGAAGNRLAVTDLNGRSVSYSYDAAYRLVNETVTDSVGSTRITEYEYDLVGNRLGKTVNGVTESYSYDLNDRLLNAGSVFYVYDANGNRLSQTSGANTVSYSYDYSNRLVDVDNGSSQVSYTYDHSGARRSSTVNGVVTQYVVDYNQEHAQVLLELDAVGNVMVTYTYGDDLISQEREGSKYFYHYDGNSSTRQLTDESGNVANTYTYDAFGVIAESDITTPNNYLFTGEQYDPNVGFYYLRARYYDPEIGRFVTQDRFPGWKFEPATLHKYNYAHDDPVNNLDPGGEFVSVGFIGGLSSGIARSLAAVRIAFAISRSLGGAALRSLGMVVENAVGRILVQIPGATVRNGVKLVGQGGPRVLDFWVQVANRVAVIEVKYGLPRAVGPALTRLVGQMQTALTAQAARQAGAQVVLFTYRAPSAAQMALLMQQLGPQASMIQHVHGLWGLVQWARFFFLLP